MNDGIEYWSDLAGSGWLANEEKSMKRELWVYETVGDVSVRNRDTDTGQQDFQTKWTLDSEEFDLFTEMMFSNIKLNKKKNEKSCYTTTRIQRRG